MLKLHRVGFRYPHSSEAGLFEELSLEVEAGQFLAVVGSSGCGKSTLLHLAARLLEPTTGQVDGTAQRSLMFQTHALLPWLRVVDNVALGLEALGVGLDERRAMARAELRRFGLAPSEAWFPGRLSVGMQQRVALARALVVRPKLLLLDEPFASLDAATRRVLQRDLVERWRADRSAVVLVTHDLAEATLLADRIVVLGAASGGSTTAIVDDVDVPEPRRSFDGQEAASARALRQRLWRILEAETRSRLQHDP